MDRSGHTALSAGGSFGELVEYVEVTLILYLAHNSALLQKVVGNLSTDWFSAVIEHDFEIFTLM